MSNHYSWGGWRAKRARLAVFAWYGDVCWLCGRAGADSVDHVIPLSWGGSDDLVNLRPAHLRCNQRRGNATRHARREPVDHGDNTTTREW